MFLEELPDHVVGLDLVRSLADPPFREQADAARPGVSPPLDDVKEDLGAFFAGAVTQDLNAGSSAAAGGAGGRRPNQVLM